MQTAKIRENDMMVKISEQAHLLQNYEQDNFELRNHLIELKKNFQVMAQEQSRNREAAVNNQEVNLKKVHAMKTNSTVEHLWQVKKVEYDNVSQLLQELRDKNKRV